MLLTLNTQHLYVSTRLHLGSKVCALSGHMTPKCAEQVEMDAKRHRVAELHINTVLSKTGNGLQGRGGSYLDMGPHKCGCEWESGWSLRWPLLAWHWAGCSGNFLDTTEEAQIWDSVSCFCFPSVFEHFRLAQILLWGRVNDTVVNGFFRAVSAVGKIEGFAQNAAGGLIQKENGGSFSFKMPVGEFVVWAEEERGSRMKPEVQHSLLSMMLNHPSSEPEGKLVCRYPCARNVFFWRIFVEFFTSDFGK